MGLQRVGHNGSDLAHMHTHTRFCLVMLSLRLSLVILFKIAVQLLQNTILVSAVQGCESTAAAAAKSLQSCPTLCDPTDGSPLGSPVPGTLQARTLEWVAISFSNA